MDFPPQPQQGLPPLNRPYYPPSEIYVPEQPQLFAQPFVQPFIQPQAPMPVQAMMPPQAQVIEVYANRKQATWRIILLVVVLVFILLIMILPLTLIFRSIGSDRPGVSFFPDLAIFTLAMILAMIAYYGWIIWRMASKLLWNRKPILTITPEGITVGPSFYSGFFIAWNEIEAIYPSTFMYKYFCIRPRNSKQYLKRFNIVERLLRLSNAMSGLPPLVIPQIFLTRQVDEIMHQLAYFYAREVNYYHIRLRNW